MFILPNANYNSNNKLPNNSHKTTTTTKPLIYLNQLKSVSKDKSNIRNATSLFNPRKIQGQCPTTQPLKSNLSTIQEAFLGDPLE